MSFAPLAVLAFLASPAPSAGADPAAPVREAYQLEREQLLEKSPSQTQVPWRPPHRDRLMSKRLARLFATDDRYQEATGYVGNLDFDPFIHGQDFESNDVLHDLIIDVVSRCRARSEVRARFTNFRPEDIRFDVILEAGRWVIDDIRVITDGRSVSIRKLLSGAYACDPHWKGRCRTHPEP